MSQYETGGAEPPRRRRHATKRRGPGPLWMIGSGAVVVVGVLAAVTALDSGPAGRAPAVDDGHPGMPALIRPEAGAGDGADDGTPTSAVVDPSRSASGSPTAQVTPTPTATTGPSGATPSGTPSTGTTGATGSAQHPGKSGSAPGVTKKPR
ncbi:hypothetical protein ACFY7C_21640 [Streptomyces sp. NPDC012769]|uniref:hypothetical protein n=1 Tax=Streptomyces sp. NPDC012769 TaxID=3364848 RepID=UPI0036B2F7CB